MSLIPKTKAILMQKLSARMFLQFRMIYKIDKILQLFDSRCIYPSFYDTRGLSLDFEVSFPN